VVPFQGYRIQHQNLEHSQIAAHWFGLPIASVVTAECVVIAFQQHFERRTADVQFAANLSTDAVLVAPVPDSADRLAGALGRFRRADGLTGIEGRKNLPIFAAPNGVRSDFKPPKIYFTGPLVRL